VNTLEPHTPFASALNDLHTSEEAPLQKNYPGVPSNQEPDIYQRRRARDRESKPFNLKTPEGWHRMHRNYAGLCALVDQAWGRICGAGSGGPVGEYDYRSHLGPWRDDGAPIVGGKVGHV
jgi:hypothetical protein